MRKPGTEQRKPTQAFDDWRWPAVYLAVIIFNVLVITALWLFSRAYR